MVETGSPDFSSGAAWIDGEIVPIDQAKISVSDWGLTRSDITYDVVHVWDGKFFRLEDYLDRFENSVANLRLNIPQGRDEIRQILHRLVGRSGLRSSYVSMVASRGKPLIPGTRDPRQCANHFYAWAVPFIWVIKQEIAERGAHVKLSETSRRISPQSVDPTVKNYHWGDMTRALFEALDEGFDTTLLLDDDGFVTEGPGFNIFAVVDGKVLTPRAGMLEGITRLTVMEICRGQGLQVVETDISAEEFLEADEVFTATTGGGPVAVTRVNSRILGNDSVGEITQQVIDAYWQWHERPELVSEIDYDVT